jgi:DNA polymerase III subunit chi
MTERVDFYVLKSAAPKQRWAFACRLTEKAYLKDLRVVIFSDSAADAKAFDDLLWTFSDRSFVPHEVCRDGQSLDAAAAVRLTLSSETVGAADLLVNLSDRLPLGLEHFTRVAEILDADPERLRLGRERFRTYREQKLTLETHQVADTAET